MVNYQKIIKAERKRSASFNKKKKKRKDTFKKSIDASAKRLEQLANLSVSEKELLRKGLKRRAKRKAETERIKKGLAREGKLAIKTLKKNSVSVLKKTLKGAERAGKGAEQFYKQFERL